MDIIMLIDFDVNVYRKNGKILIENVTEFHKVHQCLDLSFSLENMI